MEDVADLLTLDSGFEADRLNLSEKYAGGDKNYEDSVYEQVEHIRFRVYLPTIDKVVGDRQTYLMENRILQNELESGYLLPCHCNPDELA